MRHLHYFFIPFFNTLRTIISTASMYRLFIYPCALYPLIPSLPTTVIPLIAPSVVIYLPLSSQRYCQFRVSSYPSILNALVLSLCIDFPYIIATVHDSNPIHYYLNVCLQIYAQEFSKKKANKHLSQVLHSDFDV
jgi:hypothetical protein